MDTELQFNAQGWVSDGSVAGVEFVTHPDLKLEGERRTFPNSSNRLPQMELGVYQDRQKSSCLVRCIGARILQNEDKFWEVITERIPIKWGGMPLRSFDQAYYAFSQCLEGFGELFLKSGAFKISDQMIGLNNDGEVRVWFNKNFALNHPDAVADSEIEMVDQITKILEDRCETGAFASELKELLGVGKGFSQTLELLKKFIADNKIELPKSINLKEEQNYMMCTAKDN